MIHHLNSSDELGAAGYCCGYMNSFHHLLLIRTFLKARCTVSIDAVRTLHRMGYRQGDQSFLTFGQCAFFEDFIVPFEKLVAQGLLEIRDVLKLFEVGRIVILLVVHNFSNLTSPVAVGMSGKIHIWQFDRNQAMKRQIIFQVLTALVCAVAVLGCMEDRGPYAPDLESIRQSPEEGRSYARVLIPAGSTVVQEKRGGDEEPRPIGFLPYPGNWAEVVQPEVDVSTIILTDALKEGSILEIEPVATLQLDSAGVAINVVVSVPADSVLQSIELHSFVDLITDYEPVRHILQTWFVNYRGFGTFEVIGWRDESHARQLLGIEQ